jgi:hypothetical protein
MLIILISSQLLLSTPYRAKMVDDTLNGRPLKTYETLICSGSVILNVFGSYAPNSAEILINGETIKTVDAFPAELTVCDGDLIEISLKPDGRPFYVYLTGVKGEICTDLEESTLLISPGINRIVRIMNRLSF